MINILELDSSKGWGGQEKRTLRVINSLDKDRFKVFLVAHKDSEYLKNSHLFDATPLELNIRQSYDVSALFKLISIIKKYSIDIVVTHSGKDGWIGALGAKIAGCKCVRVRHLQTQISSPLSYNLSSKVVAVSNFVKNYLEDAGVKEEKLVTIHTGVDVKSFEASGSRLRDELGVGKDIVLVGIVAVLRAAKRHDDLLKAFSMIEGSAKLVIIGSGPREEYIKNLISELKLEDRVFMLGHREDIKEIMHELDIFVLPSREEALGTAIIEASSAGVATLGSSAGGIGECVGDGGLIFEALNVEDLKEKLERLINDRELREKLAKNAKELAQRSFSIESMKDKTQRLYEKLVKT